MTAADKRRRRLREEQFGADSWNEVWQGPDEKKGYACVPRVLPVLLQLAHDKAVTLATDCRSTYLELLTRNWGQGFIEIRDEQEHALRAGYTSPRSLRTWRERMRLLKNAGFIEMREKAFRPIGYVLLRHPHKVIGDLRAAHKVDGQLWLLYCEICEDFGVEPPPDPLAPPHRAVADAPVNADDIPF